MKTIQNKKVKVIDPSGSSLEMSYTDLIDVCIKFMPPNGTGLTYEVMKSIGKIEPLLVRTKKTIELEDADYNFVKSKVMSMQWAFYCKEFLTFQKDIENLSFK